MSTLREAVERLADEWASDPVGDDIWRADAVDALRALLADHPATPAEEVAEVAVEEREAAIRRSLARLLVDEYGETPRDWCELGSVRRIARALSDEIATHDAALTAKAKAEGRVEALREAADAVEGGVLPSHPNSGYRDGFARAAQIVRGLTWESP